MPKIGTRAAVTAPVVAAPAYVHAPAPRPEHDPADHIVFTNADGTRSRICICACDDCWPPAAGKSPAPVCEWSV
jgi:hypothetical protein